MYAFGGTSDEQRRACEPLASAAHWARILWRLDPATWQWHRHLPEVRFGITAASRVASSSGSL
jgi:hypothetical protein